MAIYYCRFQMITRNEGRSAVAAAAYRSGEKITNIWDGVEHDCYHTAVGGINDDENFSLSAFLYAENIVPLFWKHRYTTEHVVTSGDPEPE